MPTPYRPAPGRKAPKWCVYVLLCADGAYYVGVTSKLASRLRAHIRGKAAKRTMDVRPLYIVAVLPVGYDRDWAWHMERRCYWAMETGPGLNLAAVDGWIPGEKIYAQLHKLYPETFRPGAEGLLTPGEVGVSVQVVTPAASESSLVAVVAS